MRGTCVRELRVGQADAFEIRQMLAELFEAFVVNAAATMAHFGDFGPAGTFGIGFARHRGADEGEGFEVREAREGFHPRIGEFAVVGEAQCFEIRELAEWRDPFVVGLRRDHVERLQRGDVAEVLKESGVIGIDFAVVVRAGVWHGEIDKFEALAVLGLFDFSFGGFHDASHGLNVRIERKSRSGER